MLREIFSNNNFHYRSSSFTFESYPYIKKIILTSLIAGISIIFKLIEIPTFSSFLKLDIALVAILIFAYFGTYPFVLGATVLVDLISLRGNILGWAASFLFSLSLVNGVFVFNFLFRSTLLRKKRLLSFLLAIVVGGIITTLFLFVANAFFITPAFFAMSYEQMSSPSVWSNISPAFFGISDYTTAMFLFYSAFNFLLKIPVLLVLTLLIIIAMFYNFSKTPKEIKI